MQYPEISGTAPISDPTPPATPSASAVPSALASPPPPKVGSKHIFAFWHTGISTLPPYLLRNIIAWHSRFARSDWNIYVLDSVPSSPLNVANFIDTTSPSVVPAAFTNGTLSGEYSAQHTSDLIRYPLLLKYGGVYLDAGILQFGDLNWMWTRHVGNPDSPYDFAGFTMGDPPDGLSIVNFAMMCTPNNPLVLRAHKILRKLWEGKTDTRGLHSHPLVNHLDLMRVSQEVAVTDDVGGKMVINDESMTDYAIQIQAMGAAERWLDPEDDWDGSKYVREKCWLLSMMRHAFVPEQMTGWNGRRKWELLSMKLPGMDEEETEDQKLAREIVQKTVSEGWCLKLGHGFSAKLFGGDTLGMLWRKHSGSDCAEGTYAGWLRWAEVHCQQSEPPRALEIPVYQPTRVAPLSEYL
ncbi:hypothetical protein OHC33_002796 [Knufia fluminis]|uniref:Capsule polysaccharide biosynthesis protein n=1 Tax=Knufia fluminis TaxID=191047 RepID=A0AAN8EY03_9EURO|nr:hypothetical protein OHC33_002796 [Knufia fluminis]